MALVTLLTDFGLRDSYVAEMKGVLLREAPDVVLCDITHEVRPGDVRAAAYLLDRIWPQFPDDTIHLAVVDPGVGTSRAALALRARNQFFVGPDNGLFTPIFRTTPVEIVELPVSDGAAPTFHGRDVFAPAAAALAAGAPLHTLGAPFTGMPERFVVPEPRQENSAVIGEVIYVDRFGTLVTNLAPDQVPADAALVAGDVEVGPLRRTFGDVPVGGLLAFIGSGGTIEIAVRDGSATRRLGLDVGDEVRVRLG